MDKKIIRRNFICSVMMQIVTIISGFVIPKIILSNFGSATNGLISSITQFLSYIQLLEGGVSSVVMAALYKPLANGDSTKISGVINAAQHFFRKIGLVYILYVIIIAVVYPMTVETGYPYFYSVCLVLVLAINLLVHYFLSLAYRLLLNADRRIYIVSITQVIIVIINLIAAIILANLFHDILIIKLASGLVFFLQPIVFGWYVGKHYKLDKNAIPDQAAMEQRWDGFGINFAYFIHTNTDVVILTLFSTFSNVSVYAVYSMVVKAIRGIAGSVAQAIEPSVGRVLSEGSLSKTNTAFDKYEFVNSAVTTFIFSCAIVLITAFVDVYTIGINDTNYHQTLFGTILCLSEMVWCLRNPYISAVYVAAHFRQTSKYAYIEAIMNVVISLLLVKPLGIVGIAIGTLISMIYRMVAHIVYLKKNILYRPAQKSLRNLLASAVSMVTIFVICNQITNLNCLSYAQWVMSAIETSLIACVVILLVFTACQREQMMCLLRKLFAYGEK